MTNVYDIEIGSVLDGFKIEKELGRGGMGVVYKAHELSLNRKVALKLLSHRLCDDTEFVERFKREARIIAALNHPNLVRILSYGETQGIYYFAMEYLTGRDLGQILKEKRQLPLDEALSIVSQVAGALADAGARGVVHRDLKPANIMVDELGRVKVTDFGVAHFEGTENRLTRTGLFLGTPEYASPEQATGKTLDGRSDIYALGAVLYAMLSGRAPVTGASPLAVVAKIATEPVVPIRQLYPELPVPVCDLVDKMMARDIDERFQTAEAVMAAVDRCVNGLKGDVPPVKGHATLTAAHVVPVPARKRGAGFWGGILGVALAVLLVVWFVEGGMFRSEEVEPVQKDQTIDAGENNDIAPSPPPVAPATADAGSQPIAGAGNRTTADASDRGPQGRTPVSTPEAPARSEAGGPVTSPGTERKMAAIQADQDARLARIPAPVSGSFRENAPPPVRKAPVLPKIPRVLLAISGEDSLALQVRPYLESTLRASGLPVTSIAEIPVLSQQMQFGGTPITWHSIRQVMPAGEIQILVLAEVRKTGAMDLQYYGRRQEMITAAFSARAVDMASGGSVGMPAVTSFQYTSLNMPEKIKNAVRSSTAGMGPAIRRYWGKKMK